MAASTLVRSRADGGAVAVIAESAIPTVQSLIRWDPVGHAESELAARDEVALPPAVHLAVVDGEPAAVHALLDAAHLPAEAEPLGPVDLPRVPGARPGWRWTARCIGCWCGCPGPVAWNWRRRCGGR
jgi:primosomal protein N' (replication factor Y)